MLARTATKNGFLCTLEPLGIHGPDDETFPGWRESPEWGKYVIQVKNGEYPDLDNYMPRYDPFA